LCVWVYICSKQVKALQLRCCMLFPELTNWHTLKNWFSLTNWRSLTNWLLQTNWRSLTNWHSLTNWRSLTNWLSLTNWRSLTSWLLQTNWLSLAYWLSWQNDNPWKCVRLGLQFRNTEMTGLCCRHVSYNLTWTGP